jgi:DNA processing protein
MNWDLHEGPKKKTTFSLENFEVDEQMVLQILLSHNNQLMIDELSWRSNIGVGKLASILLALEFKGVVNALPGKIFKIKT